MFRIKIDDKKESFFFAIALGCVLLLAIGVTVIYWTHQTGNVVSGAGDRMPGTVAGTLEQDQGMRSEGGEKADPQKMTSRVKPYAEKEIDDSSMWFFGTLICALFLLVGLTFRYYSYREVKEAEKRWEKTMRNFVARMHSERVNSDDGKYKDDIIWSRILKGEEIEASEIDSMPMSNPR